MFLAISTSKTDLMKKQIEAHRNILLSELEPEALLPALAKSTVFSQEAIDEMRLASTCSQKIDKLLTFVEKGDSAVVDEFVSVLRNVGFVEIVELLDPSDLHSKAGES